jgi:hypothetical protein
MNTNMASSLVERNAAAYAAIRTMPFNTELAEGYPLGECPS